MLSVNLLLNFAVDLVVLFYVAGLLGVPRNSAVKAFSITLISYVVGYFAGPIVFKSFLFGAGTFFMALIVVLFIRLILIATVYRIGLFHAVSVWIVSAIASILLSLFLPF